MHACTHTHTHTHTPEEQYLELLFVILQEFPQQWSTVVKAKEKSVKKVSKLTYVGQT